jgi:hypothetical protein
VRAPPRPPPACSRSTQIRIRRRGRRSRRSQTQSLGRAGRRRLSPQGPGRGRCVVVVAGVEPLVTDVGGPGEGRVFFCFGCAFLVEARCLRPAGTAHLALMGRSARFFVSGRGPHQSRRQPMHLPLGYAAGLVWRFAPLRATWWNVLTSDRRARCCKADRRAQSELYGRSALCMKRCG